jgi:hypothetical protein
LLLIEKETLKQNWEIKFESISLSKTFSPCPYIADRFFKNGEEEN